MTGATNLPAREKIGPDTPLRLQVAAAVAYPDGSMTASGLRLEASRGRLVIERTAGKDYTTLAAIDRMRELCRNAPKALDCGSGAPAATPPELSHTKEPTSSSMADVNSELDALLTSPRRQNKRSRAISRKSIQRPLPRDYQTPPKSP